MDKPRDPRSVANFILNARRLIGRDTTNLEMQKILFFCYTNFLTSTGRRLIKGHFEAWKYGPVQPVVYNSFRHYGGAAILSEATGTDPFTKEPIAIKVLTDQDEKAVIMSTVASLARLTAGQLVDLSHRTGGAWDETVKMARSGGQLGMRITDEIILTCMKRTTLVSYDSTLNVGRHSQLEDEVRHYVEEPIAGYGSR